jgi:exocyst complex protein 7
MFERLGCIQDTCFVETAKGVIIHILNFVEEIAISQRSPEMIFSIINMFESLSVLLPVIKSIVLGKSCTSTRT